MFEPASKIFSVQFSADRLLSELLSDLRHTRVTDKRDHVYGILGLCDDLSLELSTWRPDYRKDVHHVYTDAARHVIQIERVCGSDPRKHSTGFLGSISTYVYMPSTKFPSWVPRWDLPTDPKMRLEMLSIYPFQAAGKTLPLIFEARSSESKILSLGGLKICSIQESSNILHGSTSFYEGLGILWTFLNLRLPSYTGPNSIETTFIQTIAAGKTPSELYILERIFCAEYVTAKTEYDYYSYNPIPRSTRLKVRKSLRSLSSERRKDLKLLIMVQG